MDGLSNLAPRLMAYKGRWPALAAESGVPYHTLRKIGTGTVDNPRLRTIRALLETLDRWDGIPQ